MMLSCRYSSWFKIASLFLFLSLLQCKPRVAADSSETLSARKTGWASLPTPQTIDAVQHDVILDAVKAALGKASPEVVEKVAPGIAHYMAFMGLSPSFDEKLFNNTLAGILSGSTQFVVCPTFTDWACLEQDPVLTPKSAWRKADSTHANMGEPVSAGKSLNWKAFFTENWAPAEDRTPNHVSVADELAKIMTAKGNKSIAMAFYGMRGIKTTIKSIWDAINQKLKDGVPLRAVVDQAGFTKPKFNIVYSYVKPSLSKLGSGQNRSVWAFGPIVKEDAIPVPPPKAGARAPLPQSTWMSFTYADTPALLNLLNGKAKKDDQAMARVEWSNQGIMHNKFAVFEDNNNKKSVWAGTANVSDSCMGTEDNSNMGIWIDNDAIASSYLEEFEEMFQYDDKIKVSAPGVAEPFPVGRFHHNKRPNTKRYFTFTDGTELRLHFAPTDDGTHRAILPILLSAKKGDRIRISMFGNSGIEFVRAIQYAVSVGAAVQVLLDKEQSGGSYSWVGKLAPAKLTEENPYKESAGSLEWRINAWKHKNHLKSATVTHANGVAEIIITGSQNWSVGGNDGNDENMVTVRNPKGIKIAEEFNAYFDNFLWKNSKVKGGVDNNVPTDMQDQPEDSEIEEE